MYHDLPRTARFWWFLFAVDQNLADAIRKIGCSCGGRLHSADYLRKPRGGPAEGEKTCSANRAASSNACIPSQFYDHRAIGRLRVACPTCPALPARRIYTR
jgi:hypothetical protein